jgi:hypothetical protein
MFSSIKLELVLAQFVWKQQLQLLQIKLLVTHLQHTPHFPERLPKIIVIAKFLTTLA